MGPLGELSEHVEELTSSFDSVIVFGANGVGLTQYTTWAIVTIALTLLVVFLAGKRLSVSPTGNRFVGMVEYGYDHVRGSIAENAIGHGFERHVPFLATLFFFIFICNLVGLIPGAKAVTGTLGVTWALSLCSFVYFNYWGFKVKGGWGYIKSIAPSGLPTVMVPIIWFFEFISLVLRLLTLAVRLYGNMFAGHMVLGIFSLLTSIFITYAVQNVAYVVALPSIAWFVFLLAMYALECLVAYLQAYVFTTLSAVYIALATSEH